MLSLKPRHLPLLAPSYGAPSSPLKKRLAASVCLAPMLLSAALAGCNQQAGAAKEAAPKAAEPVASVAPVAVAAPEAVSAPASAASEAAPVQNDYQFPPLTPEAEAVRQRAQERWDALLANDFERAWTYLEPAVREGIKQRDYKNRFGAAAEWVSVEARNVKCITARCAVLVRMTTRVAMPTPTKSATMEITNHFEEEWVQEEGQWWHRGLRKRTPQKGEEALPSAAAPTLPRPSAALQGAFGGS